MKDILVGLEMPFINEIGEIPEFPAAESFKQGVLAEASDQIRVLLFLLKKVRPKKVGMLCHAIEESAESPQAFNLSPRIFLGRRGTVIPKAEIPQGDQKKQEKRGYPEHVAQKPPVEPVQDDPGGKGADHRERQDQGQHFAGEASINSVRSFGEFSHLPDEVPKPARGVGPKHQDIRHRV